MQLNLARSVWPKNVTINDPRVEHRSFFGPRQASYHNQPATRTKAHFIRVDLDLITSNHNRDYSSNGRVADLHIQPPGSIYLQDGTGRMVDENDTAISSDLI